jgi:RimJ/RimL family protein N-acetyltransferase
VARVGAGPELRTERLALRPWRDVDREPFAAMNADPEVVRYLPGPLTRAESDALVDRIEGHFAEHGFGLWAAEVVDSGDFVGFVGFLIPTFDAPFVPAVEVGWRLARSAWGLGYATEGARRVLAFGFDELDLDEVVSFTVPANRPSRAVMERLGMTHDRDGDFDHPRLPPDSPLRHHVLYRLTRTDWEWTRPSGGERETPRPSGGERETPRPSGGERETPRPSGGERETRP